MCGILGTIPSTDIIKFKRGLTSIAHRGPDGEGVWEEENNKITLGHRRLAILDLSERGKQPMEYGDFVITYNGEIFNFLEIKKELQQKGHSFQTESDTEVILAAFLEWKEKCLLKFNGMWAFAIWNKKTNSLFLSRDRFGIKPLYYTFSNGIFAFGSEMKALFPFLSQLEISENFDYLKNNLFSYESTKDCLIKEIKRFPAGSYVYFEPNTNKQRRLNPIQYWDTKEHLVTVPKSYNEQVEVFRELFIDACKIRMRADVPIGTALSGGLDSSATISTMSHISKTRGEMRQAKDWQHAFVATFPNTFLDESYYAKKVTDSLNIKSTFLPIDPVKGIENLEHYLYLFEELYLTSPVPMMDIYKSIRENGVVVSIDGHGADELMSGYGHIPLAIQDCGFRMDKVHNILQLMKGMNQEHAQISKNSYNWNWYYEKLNYQAGGGRKNIIKYLLKDMMGKIPKEKAQKAQYGVLNTELYELFHKTVLPTLLRNYDRYSMASGVEIRMPFMDYRLVTFAFSLPWESKVKNGYSKSILRDALKGILTDEVRLRKSKIGFNTPIVDWLQGAWKEYILDTIHSQDFENAQTINPTEVRTKLIDVINNPKALFQEGEQAWTGLMPYLWEQAILKPKLSNAK